MSSQAASQAIYAVSAIIDPLTEHSLEKKVLVISTRGSDRSICLQRNGIAGGERMAGTAIGSRPESSTIAPNSTLVSLYGSANMYIYGVMNDGTGTIARFSPMFMPMQAVSSTGRIAGSSYQGSISIFYETVSNGLPAITMMGSSGKGKDSGAQDVNPGTWVGAITDSNLVKWVVFQRRGGQVAILNQNKGKQTDVNTDVKYFSDKTSLAITLATETYASNSTTWETQKGRSKLFVYWLDPRGVLLRAIAEVSSETEVPTFGQPQEVQSKPHILDPCSQMSVVCDYDAEKNYIYTAVKRPRDETKIIVIADRWGKGREEEE